MSKQHRPRRTFDIPFSTVFFEGRSVSQALEFGAVIIKEPTHDPFGGINRRSLHPIDSISRRLDFICTTATDPLQIAAALESDGVNDRIAREEYGFSDVFDLAEELYRRVPLRPPDYVPRFSEPLVRTGLRVSRGLMVVPVLWILPALAGIFGARTVALNLIVLLGTAWLWGLLRLPQDVWLVSQGRRVEARTKLWISGGLAIITSIVVAGGLTALTGGPVAWVAVQAGLSLLLISTLVLIARAQESWAWLALSPVGVIGALVMFTNGIPIWAGLVGLAISVALSIAVTWQTTFRTPGTESESVPEPSLEPLALVVFGVFSFVLVALLPGFAWGRGNVRLGLTAACAVLPLALCAGVLSWGVGRFRRWSLRLLSSVNSPGAFIKKARTSLLSFLGVGTVVIAGASLVSFTLWAETGLNASMGAMLLGANTILGLALASSLTLIGRNRVRETLLPWGFALAVCVAALGLGWAGFALLAAFLGACVILMVWTVFLMWRSLGSVAG
jgi:hypothetical protein